MQDNKVRNIQSNILAKDKYLIKISVQKYEKSIEKPKRISQNCNPF